jgi:hypothetical protein
MLLLARNIALRPGLFRPQALAHIFGALRQECIGTRRMKTIRMRKLRTRTQDLVSLTKPAGSASEVIRSLTVSIPIAVTVMRVSFLLPR